MGRCKFRLGRRIKNYERVQLKKKVVGRPRSRRHKVRDLQETKPTLDSDKTTPTIQTPPIAHDRASPIHVSCDCDESGGEHSSSLDESNGEHSDFPDQYQHSSQQQSEESSINVVHNVVNPHHQGCFANLELPYRWSIQGQNEDSFSVCKISDCTRTSSQSLVISHCITVRNDMSWSLSVHGVLVDTSKCAVLVNVPTKLSDLSLNMLVLLLDKSRICAGNPDEKFISMLQSKKQCQLLSKDAKSVIARVDDFLPVTLNGKEYGSTVRVSTCEMLVHGSKCASCVSYRDHSLRALYHRWQERVSVSIT